MKFNYYFFFKIFRINKVNGFLVIYISGFKLSDFKTEKKKINNNLNLLEKY